MHIEYIINNFVIVIYILDNINSLFLNNCPNLAILKLINNKYQ